MKAWIIHLCKQWIPGHFFSPMWPDYYRLSVLPYLLIFTQIQQVMTNREQGHYYLTSHKKLSEVEVLWYHSHLVWFVFKVLSRGCFHTILIHLVPLPNCCPLLTTHAQCMESSRHLQQPRYNTPPGSMHTSPLYVLHYTTSPWVVAAFM